MLADSSVWVAHFRKSNGVLQSMLAADRVLSHPLIVLELACGTPPAPRDRTLGDIRKLEQSEERMCRWLTMGTGDGA